MPWRTHATMALALMVFGGCVSQAKYDKALQETADARKALAETTGRATDAERQIADLKAKIVETEAKLQGGAQETSTLKLGLHEAEAHLDEQTAISQQLRAELARLGKNVDQLLSDKGTLAKSLDDAKKRLEELRRAQAAAEARAALFRDLALKFRQMADTGQLKVELRNGRIMIQLPNDVLFDSGHADLKPAGKTTLAKIADVLRGLADRQYQVAGHTDNVPIRNAPFPSNWSLSSARATAVVQLLVEKGVKPEALSAAGYAEFDPLAPNDTSEHKAKNRRIEISLVPKIDELPAIPGS
ncbi:MAG TPA: OmpA family protein [Polyangiaceae bacterium]|nr:OmpA family protein [Polyangiaceae bacterium]